MRRLVLVLCAGLLAACADDVNKTGDSSGKISAPPAARCALASPKTWTTRASAVSGRARMSIGSVASQMASTRIMTGA